MKADSYQIVSWAFMRDNQYPCFDCLQQHTISAGNHLEGKTTAVPLRKPHGAAVFSLHEILANGLSGDQEEKDIQMDVYVYVTSIACLKSCLF